MCLLTSRTAPILGDSRASSRISDSAATVLFFYLKKPYTKIMKLLDGKRLALKIEQRQKIQVAKLRKTGIIPTLAVILAGEDPASGIYVSKKQEAGKRIGVEVKVFRYPKSIKTEKIVSKIESLNRNKKIHGIIVQLPLPNNINQEKIIESISPEKDVDGFHPLNWGKLAYKSEGLLPCTPAGIMEILHFYKIPLKGKEVVIVGKGNFVGKPLSILLLNSDATLTVVHLATKNLKFHTRRADVLISAAGVPNLIKKDMVKKGAVVIDVGISRNKGKITGDVDFNKVSKIASYITPVPGGIGPITVAMLLENVIKIARH